MRLASYNLENLFSRPRAMSLPTWSAGKAALEAYARANALLAKAVYTGEDKKELINTLALLGLSRRDESDLAILRRNRGELLKRRANGAIEITANGRADWVGWIELATEAVDDLATRMTARVITDVAADVLAVVEAESRDALTYFNDQLLSGPDSFRYNHVMLIDGNDKRGIDVGLLTRPSFEIRSIRSHVDDVAASGLVFSRDCPEYEIETAQGNRVVILVNHLKSKGYGPQGANDAKRLTQANRVKEIYEGLMAAGKKLVAVVGDLNDNPTRAPLKPLLEQSDLKDISTHPAFAGDGRVGTYANGSRANKIDYILLSPALYKKVTGGGVWRKGVWGGANGELFAHYQEITEPQQAASDHAALFADIDV